MLQQAEFDTIHSANARRGGQPVGPLRVLQVSQRFFPEMGGVETHMYEVARRLRARGVEVAVLATDTSGKLAPSEIVEGIPVRRVRSWPARGDYYLAPQLYQAIRAGSWDVIHLQGIHTLVPPLTMLAARHSRTPYVVTFHTGGHSSRLRNLGRAAQWATLKPLLAGASRLIGVSKFEAELFRRRLGLPAERFTTIRNGSQLPRLTGRPQARDPNLLLSVGRLERYKGHHRAIAALPLLLSKRPELRLLILGAGPHEGELRRQAAALGVAERVEIRVIPPSDREAMADVLGRAALMTLFSEYEAHPIAVMEAVARQCPVLVADTSGLSELAEEGLVPAVPLSLSDEQLAAAMLAQLERPLIPAQVELPTWERCVAQLMEVYERAAGRVACAS